MTSAAHAVSSDDIWTFIEANWIWVLIFGGGIIDFLLETFDAGIGSIARAGRRRHRRRMERLRLQLKIEKARAATQVQLAGDNSSQFQAGRSLTMPRPGRCVHRNVTAVVASGTDDVVAWLCKTCDTKLPPDWAVREEDL